MREFGKRLLWVLAFLLVLTATGTAGYVVIEDAHLADAVYMTAITLTAVGYEEVIPLSQAGRTFTMLLLLGGFTWMGLWFAVLTAFIVELDLQHVFRRRGVMRAIER